MHPKHTFKKYTIKTPLYIFFQWTKNQRKQVLVVFSKLFKVHLSRNVILIRLFIVYNVYSFI